MYVFFSSAPDISLEVGNSICGIDFSADDIDPALIQSLILKLKKKAKQNRPKKHTCNECQFKAHKADKLRTHIEKVHLKIKNYHCSDCGFSAYDNSTLKQHFNSVHLKIKRFSCSICGFQAYAASAVRSHQRSAHMKTGPVLPIEQGDVPTMSTSTNSTPEEDDDNSGDQEMGDASQSKKDEESDPAESSQKEESEGDPSQVQEGDTGFIGLDQIHSWILNNGSNFPPGSFPQS